MAGSINKCLLIGNLGKDPEIRNTQDGNKIVNLTLATSEDWTDRASGEKKSKVEWHRVVVFNDRIADVAERYLKKGAKIYVEGSLQTRKYQDQQGVEKYSTEIVIGRFNGQLTMLGSAPDNEAATGNGQGAPRAARPAPARTAAASRLAAPARSGGPSWDPPSGGDLDDAIPF